MTTQQQTDRRTDWYRSKYLSLINSSQFIYGQFIPYYSSFKGTIEREKNKIFKWILYEFYVTFEGL